MYGLAREQLLHEGKVVPSILVLSHDEQLERLSEQCPEALGVALVAGDPCFDRLVASVPWRDDYRESLGLRAGQRLVVATSTWGPQSLLGQRPELPARLLAELPSDEYRVAAVVHPNVWHEHGPWQLRAWLNDCRRAGLLVIPPREGWRAALVAADAVVGDHGSVTLYAAALGRPVLFGAFPHDEVDPGTAMAELGRRSSFIEDGRPVGEQIESVLAGHGALVADEAFAAQGHSAEILRTAMYRLMRLKAPPAPARVLPVPPPEPEPRVWEHAERPALLSTVEIRETPGHAVFVVERYPAEVADLRTQSLRDAHLVVDGTETDHRLRGLADILVHRAGAGSRPAFIGEGASRTTAETTRDGCCLLRFPNGHSLADGEVLMLRPAVPVDPGVLASAVYAWIRSGRALAALPSELTVAVGRVRAPFEVTTTSG